MPDYLAVFDAYRHDLTGALEQITDDEFFESPGGGANSAAVIVRHLSGNFTSRFTELLTTDGEKPWREREQEFQPSQESRLQVMENFERAWQIMHDAISSLTAADMSRTVTIRDKPLTTENAVLRSAAPLASPARQAGLVGRQFRGGDWEYLSIPPAGATTSG